MDVEANNKHQQTALRSEDLDFQPTRASHDMVQLRVGYVHVSICVRIASSVLTDCTLSFPAQPTYLRGFEALEPC